MKTCNGCGAAVTPENATRHAHAKHPEMWCTGTAPYREAQDVAEMAARSESLFSALQELATCTHTDTFSYWSRQHQSGLLWCLRCGATRVTIAGQAEWMVPTAVSGAIEAVT